MKCLGYWRDQGYINVIKAFISELRQLVDDKTHSKDSGLGLLRMAKLVNLGISFCYADGRDCTPESWMDYFNKSMILD